jgi:hypothetical protein
MSGVRVRYPRVMYSGERRIQEHFPRFLFISVRLVVGILLNECKGFCRARLNGTLEGFGVAANAHVQTSTVGVIRSATYLIVPDEGLTSGVISTPFSTTLEMSNAASDMAVDIQAEASARWRPGQSKNVRKLPCQSIRSLRVPGQILRSRELAPRPRNE